MSLIPSHSYWEALNGGNFELLRSNFMNVCLFFPAGILFYLLLPESYPYGKRAAITMLIFMCFSMPIETMQHALSLGHFETDDILHNTLGAVIGCV